jgi:hypothetical protein
LKQIAAPVYEVGVPTLPRAENIIDVPTELCSRPAGCIQPGPVLRYFVMRVIDLEKGAKGLECIMGMRATGRLGSPDSGKEGAAHGVFRERAAFILVAVGTSLIGDISNVGIHILKRAGVINARVPRRIVRSRRRSSSE